MYKLATDLKNSFVGSVKQCEWIPIQAITLWLDSSTLNLDIFFCARSSLLFNKKTDFHSKLILLIIFRFETDDDFFLFASVLQVQLDDSFQFTTFYSLKFSFKMQNSIRSIQISEIISFILRKRDNNRYIKLIGEYGS